MDEHKKFKIGDRVRVLFINEYSESNFEEMRLSVGKILTVTGVHHSSFTVRLDNRYWYRVEWLQPIQDGYSEISKRLAVL